MRKITKESVTALLNGYTFKSGNTQVTEDRELKLFGHTIAKYINGSLHISNCGCITVTTKERLNGLLEMLNTTKLYQRDGAWYYDNKEGIRLDFPSDTFVSIRTMRG